METHELENVVLDAGIEGASVGLKGVIGIPAGDGPWPGIVVVHEAFGIDAEMRKQISHLAALGYLALMPDLFTEGGFRRCIWATFRAMTSGEGRAYADIETARRTLVASADCTGEVGVIGFCMGGGFAIMTAARGFDVAAVNYGIMPKDLEAVLEGACPIVASYGAEDATLRGAAAKLERTLTDKGIPHDVKEYPGAGHAFLNEKMTGPAVMAPFARVMNFGPKPEAAVDAWRRIGEFFAEQLSGNSPR
jgi:carboxymethylenebutenolidase